MEWITIISKSISYMEDHLLDISSPQQVADEVNVSCMYLQKGFQMLTGYSLGEYMRNRKLYLAALQLRNSQDSVIDIAMQYGYDSPSAFDKAFYRFHGGSPLELRKGNCPIHSFLRLQLNVSVTGGENMNFRIEKKESFKVVGVARNFDLDVCYHDIPMFWDEFMDHECSNIMKGLKPASDKEQYIYDHHIGEFGLCIDDIGGNQIRYAIAGYYDGKDIPEGFEVFEVEENQWAVFECRLKTLQQVNDEIWKNWLVNNSEYQLAGKYNIEWYSPNSVSGPDMECEIWIPVVRK